MQAQINCTVQVCKGFYLQPCLDSASLCCGSVILLICYIRTDRLDISAMVILDGSHHLIHAGKCLNSSLTVHGSAILMSAVLVQEIYRLADRSCCCRTSCCSRINRIISNIAYLNTVTLNSGTIQNCLLNVSVIPDCRLACNADCSSNSH